MSTARRHAAAVAAMVMGGCAADASGHSAHLLEDIECVTEGEVGGRPIEYSITTGAADTALVECGYGGALSAEWLGRTSPGYEVGKCEFASGAPNIYDSSAPIPPLCHRGDGLCLMYTITMERYGDPVLTVEGSANGTDGPTGHAWICQ